MSFLFGRQKPRHSSYPSSDAASHSFTHASSEPHYQHPETTQAEHTMGHRFSRHRNRHDDRSNTGYGKLRLTTTIPSPNLWSPPPYTQHSSNGSCSKASVGDSPFAFLREFDTVFLVDDSCSMMGRRWKEAEEAIAAIAPICTLYDADGIDIYFLNHRRASTTSTTGAYMDISSADDVREIFNSVTPNGATPVGNRLHQILKPYLRRVEAMAAATDKDGNLTDPSLFVKPLNIIAITDGVFTDDAESVIVSVAKRLDGPKCKAVPWQVGIQFFQVGDDEAARRYLEELDDDLAKRAKDEHLRDIVDTVPWKGYGGRTLSANGILKCVLGAVHKKYDNRQASP